MDKENIICTKDYTGKKTVFTKKQLELKVPYRPELSESGIIDRIKKTIEEPTFVYEDFENKKRLAYYFREFKINNRTRYIKVILHNMGSYLFVVTAYRPDYVKERSKTKLIYGKDND